MATTRSPSVDSLRLCMFSAGAAMDDSRSAFEQFVVAEATPLLRFAVLVTGDRHAAEDLTQSVLEALYRRWS